MANDARALPLQVLANGGAYPTSGPGGEDVKGMCGHNPNLARRKLAPKSLVLRERDMTSLRECTCL